MRHLTLKEGDVLLFPTRLADFLNTIEPFSKSPVDWRTVAQVMNHKYIHAELYVGNNYSLGQGGNGVHLNLLNIDVLTRVHVYRLVDQIPQPEMKSQVESFVRRNFNKQYDWVSLVLNGLTSVLSLGNDWLEQNIENFETYSNQDKLICSELVARFYEESFGLKVERKAEFVTPDDIAQSQLFRRLV